MDEDTAPPPAPERHLPPWLRDLLPAVLLLPPGLVATPMGPSVLHSLTAAGWVLLSTVAVVLRRHRPRAAVLVVLAVVAGSLLTVGVLFPPLLGLLVVVFSMARRTDRRTTMLLALLTVVVTVAASAAYLGQGWELVRTVVQVTGLVGFAAAAGDAARSREAYVAAIIERARRAEEGRDAEARRQVAEERLTIARDLHDVVAHQIAVINLQASVASQALRSRPDDAEQSLLTIRDAARTVLTEIGSLLQVLRTSDPSPDQLGTRPVPGLGQLPRLVTDFERSGLRVDQRVLGTQVDLDPAADAAAYRIVQEGLTNAHKHGSDASALLQIEYSPQGVEINVTNTVPVLPARARRASGGGHGLTGARERAHAVGGELRTDFGPGPVHRLTALLPRRLPADGRRPT
ncbi:sensor histidine kinase [Auraticoccus monumenti]|uniref:histidine kinase n=1 Tax=Auraticoccus monumenti TaxID=675864 RepID=A0A1G6Z7K2_9ACTN|nr:histidine kinase [Auraticoccus monumenti]SDD97957.1 Signal transduction histidine kinase [Auraticoccus monumenti]